MGERKRFWNEVTMGDGTRARLVPGGCLNRITEEDGHRSCDHGDMKCSQNDRPHETISLYEVVPLPAPCPECGGSGFVTSPANRSQINSSSTRPCPSCGTDKEAT